MKNVPHERRTSWNSLWFHVLPNRFVPSCPRFLRSGKRWTRDASNRWTTVRFSISTKPILSRVAVSFGPSSQQNHLIGVLLTGLRDVPRVDSTGPPNVTNVGRWLIFRWNPSVSLSFVRRSTLFHANWRMRWSNQITRTIQIYEKPLPNRRRVYTFYLCVNKPGTFLVFRSKNFHVLHEIYENCSEAKFAQFHVNRSFQKENLPSTRILNIFLSWFNNRGSRVKDSCVCFRRKIKVI